jgi:hypothetical protein
MVSADLVGVRGSPSGVRLHLVGISRGLIGIGKGLIGAVGVTGHTRISLRPPSISPRLHPLDWR